MSDFPFRVREPLTDDAISSNNHLSELLNKWLCSNGPTAIFKNCANCRHMTTEGPAVCKQFNATPPASVIVAGCPGHEDIGDIPF
ncbi:hypothetical protein EVC17_075 [Rhizobium phage RHph_Y1_1]|nr:hypothetical protein EVB80_075 [Rhizobium phage RHph_I36]QIG75432.1 hypothetical protein EVC17_075 [Rhizobium phage RHph_Y1_1]QIG75982.1 hypothetical protein EVC21_075 [Rhizobium phage RHph_Y2_17_2]